MKRIGKAIILLAISINCFSQDIIFKIDGEEIESNIIEVNVEIVKYKKFENQEGPTYSLLKDDIFMIKYENGTKDVFDRKAKESDGISRSSLEFTKERKFEDSKVENKSKYVIFDYQINISKVITANKIYYFGMDLSLTELLNPEKNGTESIVNKYVTTWPDRFHREIPPQKYIRKWFKKDELILSFDYSTTRNSKKTGKWIVESSKQLTIEQIHDVVLNYKENISEKKGIGYILIVDCFNKEEKKTYGVHTFFDIESGNLLWVANTAGEAFGKGINEYWALGTVNSLKVFIDKIYKNSLK